MTSLTNASQSSLLVLQSYITQQDFITIIGNILSDIFHLNELPENPYPLFLDKLRSLELKNVLSKQPTNIKSKLINVLSAEDPLTHIVHSRNSLDFYGLSHIIKWIDALALYQLKSVINKYTLSEIFNQEDSHIIKICSMRGDCILFDRLCPFYGILEWCEDYIIENLDGNFEKALSIFVRRIIQRVYNISNSTDDKFIALHVASTNSSLSDQSSLPMSGNAELPAPYSLSVAGNIKTIRFNADYILDNVATMQKILKTAILSNCGVFIEFLACSSAIKADLDLDGDPDAERVVNNLAYHMCRMHFVFHFKNRNDYRSFTEYPSLSLLEGVFFTKVDADTYVELYSRYFKSDILSKLNTLVADESHEQSKFFKKILTISLFESDIIGDYRSIFYSIFLLSSFTKTNSEDIGFEFHRFTHSPSGLFFKPMCDVRTLQLAFQSYLKATDEASNQMLDVMQQQYDLFVSHISEILTVASTSDYVGISKRIYVLMSSLIDNKRKFTAVNSCVGVFSELYQLCRAIVSSTSSTIFSISPFASNLLKMIYTANNKVREIIPPIGVDRYVLLMDSMIEQEKIHKNLPNSILRESLFMKYLIVSEFDSTLSTALFEIFAGALIPNPYVQLAIKFKVASLKFDSWKETDFFLLNSVQQVPHRERTVACECLHRLKCEVNKFGANKLKLNENEFLFGMESACLVLNVKQLKDLADDLFLKDIGLIPILYNKIEESYAVKVNVSFCDETGLWGSLLDHLTFVTLNHTYTIEGPHQNASVDIFANQIISYLIQFNDFSEHLLLGLFLGYFSSFTTPSESNSNNFLLPTYLSSSFDLIYAETIEASSVACDNVNINVSATSNSKFRRTQDVASKFVDITIQATESSWSEFCPVGKMKSERNSIIAAIRIAVSLKYPIFAILYLNMGGKYRPVRIDMNALYLDSNSNQVSPFGNFPLNRCFDSIWVNHFEESNSVVADSNYTAAFRSEDLNPHNISAIDSAHNWLTIHHSFFNLNLMHDQNSLFSSPFFLHLTLFMKQNIVRCYSSGDLVSAYKLLFRYQLQRNDISGFPVTRRFMNSFAARLDHLIAEGSHILLILRAISSQNEIKLRHIPEILVVQFSQFRELLYFILNSSSFIFLVGLKDIISHKMSFMFERVTKEGECSVSLISTLEEILDLLHVICLSAANYFHLNCPDQDLIFTQFVNEIKQ